YITMERNPYYWGIDKWGNQLPFMDQITNQNYQDPQSMRLAIQQGKADYVSGDQIGITLADVQNLQNTPGMELFYWDSGDGTGSMYFFNYDYEDAKLRALFRNKVFRQAMSLAWNRENARKVIYFEQGELTAGTMSPKAVEFHVGTGPSVYKQWRTNFLSYDPKKAEQMLDSIGVKKVGQWRTMPDGSPLQITLNYAANATNDHVQKNDLLSKDWQAIGINADPSPVPPDSRLALWAAGKLQMYCDWGVGDGPNCLTYANWIVPTDPQRWAPLEGEWLLLQGTAQANAQPNVDPWSRTPPNLQPDAGGPVDRIQKLYLAAPLETDFMKRNQSVWNIMKIHLSDGPFFSGCVSNYPLVHMRKTDMKNIPRRDQTWLGGFDGPWTIVPNGMYDPSTWYWSDPTKHPVT
ncbi:MAG: ABC transporter substrate-binding protein, partial [Candidatus Dormiibacterota bacterium]